MKTRQYWLAMLVIAGVLSMAPTSNAPYPGPRKVGFPAAAWYPDGTLCTNPAGHQINGGPITSAVQCTNNSAAAIYFDTGSTPASYAGGKITLQLAAESEAASPSGGLVMQFSCQCRSTGQVPNSSWGTAQSATLTFTTQYATIYASTAALTCNGTCTTAGTTIYVRGLVNSGSTTVTMSSVYATGSTLQYTANVTS